jgi:hypothetical protein
MLRSALITALSALAISQAAQAATESAEDRTSLDKAIELATSDRKFGEYRYVPSLSKQAGTKWARGYQIQRSGQTLFRFMPKFFESGLVWLEEPLQSKGITSIPTSPERDSEALLKDSDPRLPVGGDLTGDGVPDLVVGVWTGGAHCCDNYTIFSMGKQFKTIGTIYGLDSSFEFKDLDGDGAFEAIGRDCNFRYWHECFAYSPAPLVILTLKGGRPVLAQSLMKTPPLSTGKFELLTRELKDYLTGRPFKTDGKTSECIFVSSKLWKTMLQLIYTGNGAQAWQLFDTVWPKGRRAYWENSLHPASATNGKQCQECMDPAYARRDHIVERDKFIRDFKAQLAKSSYWPALKQMNSW